MSNDYGWTQWKHYFYDETNDRHFKGYTFGNEDPFNAPFMTDPLHLRDYPKPILPTPEAEAAFEAECLRDEQPRIIHYYGCVEV
jgi:hypothetical protein